MSSGPTQPDAADRDLSGRKLGDYQILRRLGRGGMAEVYLAEQASLQRQVAFKVLKHSLSGDEAYVRRFRYEALAAAKLSHANIVQIFEVNCIEGIHFIAQEYVKGQNLKQLLARHSSIDNRLAISLMRQVAAALHRAGQQGVIHRDIKPENIMLSAAGEVKVADFGLARVLQNGDAMNLTQVGITMGTPLYMSPEQVEGKSVDQRSDLYSFGVTCYHMLAGKPPFEGETPLSIAVQHLKTEADKLEHLRPDLPPGLCRIVHKLMAKLPEARFQSAGELLRELRTLQPAGDDDEAWAAEAAAWIDSELATTTSSSGHAATQELQTYMHTAALQARRRGRAWPLATALTLAAFLVGAAVAWGTRTPPLLAVDPNVKPQIARQDSAREQYILAAMPERPSEAAIRAVWEYFPPENGSKENLYYSRRAKQRLAQLYREEKEEKQLDKAAALYKELTKVEPEEIQFQVIGHFGLANVAHQRAQQDVASTEISNGLKRLMQMPEDRRRELVLNLDEPLRANLPAALRDARVQ